MEQFSLLEGGGRAAEDTVVQIREEGGVEKQAAVGGGFAEVLGDRVTVLAETAELAESIDVERAVASRDRARERLMSRLDPDVDDDRAEAALNRALNRLRVAG